MSRHGVDAILFFFNETATPEIYTLSLHDALPIWGERLVEIPRRYYVASQVDLTHIDAGSYNLLRMLYLIDRKSTRLNSSHVEISYAVFCLKKKNTDRRKAQRASTNSPREVTQRVG